MADVECLVRDILMWSVPHTNVERHNPIIFAALNLFGSVAGLRLDFSMAKKNLREEEYLELLFDDLHDQTWLREEHEDQLLAAEHVEEIPPAEIQDLAVSHAVRFHSLVPVPPSASPVPSAGSPVPPSASPVPPSASPVPSAGSPVPPSASPEPSAGSPVPPSASPVPSAGSPVPPSASPVPPAGSLVPDISLVEIRSRKRRRGPLCPAEGVALKRLPADSYKARDNTKWNSYPNPTMPPILKIDQFETAGPTIAVFGCRTPAEVFDKFLPNALLAEVIVFTNDKIVTLRNKFKRQNDPTFKDLSLMEFRAFLGILIMTGARKDNHLTSEEMFSRSLGCPF
ncbi:uncharacterized protein LOC135226764 [Macrobrachium nipponense]|uniref:uncharacterized protein LOC135226764 n=1 Tax=Macrobrachium nipponense TaxID=159736 RepID=UPI0030C8AC7B